MFKTLLAVVVFFKTFNCYAKPETTTIPFSHRSGFHTFSAFAEAVQSNDKKSKIFLLNAEEERVFLTIKSATEANIDLDFFDFDIEHNYDKYKTHRELMRSVQSDFIRRVKKSILAKGKKPVFYFGGLGYIDGKNKIETKNKDLEKALFNAYHTYHLTCLRIFSHVNIPIVFWMSSEVKKDFEENAPHFLTRPHYSFDFSREQD